MSRWKNLPPLAAGREYTGWMGAKITARKYSRPRARPGIQRWRPVHVRRQRLRGARFEDVRRVRIIVEKEKANG